MKICINYYGQPRDNAIPLDTYKNFIKDDENEIYILYTTWDSEDTTVFENLFTPLKPYINKVEVPNLNEYQEIMNKYNMDPTNWYKNNESYFLGMYIKKESYKTIEKFKQEKSIDFDMIISLRTSIYLFNRKLSLFYSKILSNPDSVYIASDPCFNVYNEGAAPDVFYITINEDITKKVLSQLDILEKCLVNGKNFFHPETSFYKSLTYHNLNIVKLDCLTAFPQDHSWLHIK